MNTFPPKTQRAVLRSLIRHEWPVLHPVIAKALLMAGRYFTEEKYRVPARALLLNAGDLKAVKVQLEKHPAPWHKSFFTWAEKVKGGAL